MWAIFLAGGLFFAMQIAHSKTNVAYTGAQVALQAQDQCGEQCVGVGGCHQRDSQASSAQRASVRFSLT